MGRTGARSWGGTNTTRRGTAGPEFSRGCTDKAEEITGATAELVMGQDTHNACS